MKLQGKLLFFFVSSYALIYISFMLITYLNSIISIITFMFGIFLLKTIPCKSSLKPIELFLSKPHNLIIVVLFLWFINTSNIEVQKSLQLFIKEERYNPVFILLVHVFIFFKIRSHNRFIKQLKPIDIVEYYKG